VRQSAQGVGVFAARDFSVGELLFRFSGPIITLSQAMERRGAGGKVLQIAPPTFIDLEPPGAFANHSCEPNAGLRDLVSGFALRPIARGDEILFDYSTTMSEQNWTMTCHCGAPSCRGVITDFHDLPIELQRQYIAMQIVQPFIVAEWQLRHGLANEAALGGLLST
jgi:hypothetical protein